MFRYLEDIATADVAFEAWGETREELFMASAAALLATMVELPEQLAGNQVLEICLEHQELDLLLLSFLQELIFYKDARRLLLQADHLRIYDVDGLFRLESRLCGEKIDTRRHQLLVDVKAVTLHRLQVVWRDGLWWATVVLDV